MDVNGPEMVVAMAMPAVLTLRFFFAGVVLLQAVLPHKPVIHPSTGNVRAIKAILMFREYPPIENRKGSQNSTGSSQSSVEGGSETAGVEYCPSDVVGQVTEPE
ncbi:MAG: hypothetical protein E7C87_11930, partial [Cutibacterium avidum]|nr:hypothetical protein [Cutibacterium avidum]